MITRLLRLGATVLVVAGPLATTVALAASSPARQSGSGCALPGALNCDNHPPGTPGQAAGGAFVQIKAELQRLYDVRGGTFGNVGDPAPCNPPSTDLVANGVGQLYYNQAFSLITGELLSEGFRCVGPGEPAQPPAPPTREEIFNSAGIPDPTIHISPTVDGLVGLDSWLWGEDEGSVTVVAGPVRGWTVTGTVAPSEWIFDTSDGGSYSAGHAGSESSPVGSHVFSRHGTYTITHTVWWEGGFTVSGWGLTFTANNLANDYTTTVDYDVIEVEAVG